MLSQHLLASVLFRPPPSDEIDDAEVKQSAHKCCTHSRQSEAKRTLKREVFHERGVLT